MASLRSGVSPGTCTKTDAHVIVVVMLVSISGSSPVLETVNVAWALENVKTLVLSALGLTDTCALA